MAFPNGRQRGCRYNAPFLLFVGHACPVGRRVNRGGLMAIALTFLEQGKQPPATVAALLAEFLAAARTTLHLAIYDFRMSDPVAAPVIGALRDRVAAGVEVRIAYDAGKPNAQFPAAGTDPAPPGTAAFLG